MDPAEASPWQRLREDLLSAVRGRREAELRRFHDEYFPWVYGYVLSRLGGDHATAEEVASDVFFQAFRDVESYDGLHPAGVWLHGIARHRVLDVLRKKGRRTDLAGEAGPISEAALAALPDLEAREWPDALLERKELAQHVTWVLAGLPQEYQAVLRLHYMDGKTVKELAEMLGITAKAAEARLFRARYAFRDAFRPIARALDLEGIGAGHER